MEQAACEETRRPFRIVEKSQINHNVFRMRLRSNVELPEMTVCSFVRIYDDKGDSRPYTPLIATKEELTFTIKAYPDGNVSKFLHSRQTGDILYVSKFFSKRTNVINEFRKVLMIAGGTGATPMFQLLRQSILSGRNTTDYTLILLNKTDADIFLHDNLECLARESDGKLHITYVLSEGTADPRESHISGTLTKDLFMRVTNHRMFDFAYICGPPSLYNSFSGPKTPSKEQGELSGILKELGYTEENVYKF